MSVDQNNFSYSGKEELENTQYIPYYNQHIAHLFCKYMTPQAKVIDFGAGIGTIAELIKKNMDTNLTCLEVDKDQIKVLETKGFKTISSIQNYKDQADIVYSSNVLEHIEDDLGALKEIYEKVRSGGQVIFWVPAFQCIWTAMDERVGHYRRYTKKTISQAFQKAGFTLQDVYYQDSVGFFLAFLFKYVGRKDGRVNPTFLKLFDKVVFPISRFFDRFLKSFFGKNVVVIATKP